MRPKGSGLTVPKGLFLDGIITRGFTLHWSNFGAFAKEFPGCGWGALTGKISCVLQLFLVTHKGDQRQEERHTDCPLFFLTSFPVPFLYLVFNNAWTLGYFLRAQGPVVRKKKTKTQTFTLHLWNLENLGRIPIVIKMDCVINVKLQLWEELCGRDSQHKQNPEKGDFTWPGRSGKAFLGRSCLN